MQDDKVQLNKRIDALNDELKYKDSEIKSAIAFIGMPWSGI